MSETVRGPSKEVLRKVPGDVQTFEQARASGGRTDQLQLLYVTRRLSAALGKLERARAQVCGAPPKYRN